MKTINFKKYLWVLGILVLIWVFSKVNWGDFLLIFQKSHPLYFIFAFLFVPLILLIKTWRWKILLDTDPGKFTFREIWPMILKSVFWGSGTPSKLGEFVRAKYLADTKKVGLAFSVWTVFLQLLLDLLDALLLGGMAILILSGLWSKHQSFGVVALVFLLALLLGGLLIFLARKEAGSLFLRKIFQFFLPSVWQDKAEFFWQEGFIFLRKITWLMIRKTCIAELLGLVVMGLSQFCFSLALGMQVPWWYFFLIVPFLDLAVALPISVWGLGTREASYIFFLAFFGISATTSVAFSLLVLVWSVSVILPGFFLIIFEKKNYGKSNA